LFSLEKKFPNIKYCEPRVAQALLQSRSIKLVWGKEDLDCIKLVLVPCNPSGVHWILLVIDVEKGNMMVLDPINEHSCEKACVVIGKELLSRKFRKHNATVMKSSEHLLQKDSFNCGVLVCFYSKQLCEGMLY
jgi:Ulp1 family protease